MTKPVNGREYITVPAVNFDSVVKDACPNKIKIDVEGAEYSFMPYKFLIVLNVWLWKYLSIR